MSKAADNVCVPLPNHITNKISTYEDREQFIVKHLERILPSSDSKNVLEELKRTFYLDKHKLAKDRKKLKKAKSKKCSIPKFWRHRILGKNHGLVYKELLPMNEMWNEYIRQNLGVGTFQSLPTSPLDSNWESINQRLLKADYHGAIISVVRSKDTNSVGAQGIVLQETKNCFKVIMSNNCLRTLSKESSVFRFHLPDAYLEVYGKEICYKPAERSVKKFKASHLAIL